MGANDLGGTGLMMTLVLIAGFFFAPRLAITAVAVFGFPVAGGMLGAWLARQVIDNALGGVIGLVGGVVVGWKLAFLLGNVLNKPSESEDEAE